jgi:hypothetical protein
MKKINLVVIIVIGLIIITAISGCIFVYYKKIGDENKKILNNSNKENITEIKNKTQFNPAMLDWEQITQSAPWNGRDSHAIEVYNGKIWLMGGLDATKRFISPGNIDYGNAQHFSDVWSSDDGINWQLLTNKAQWGERRSMQVVEFKGKIWLMGGWGPEIGYKNNIWSSMDGVSWKMETNSPSWPAREGHNLLVFKDKMWLIGGVKYTGQKLFNDVWYSEDGIKWTEATENAGWSPRWDFSSAVFDNKLWVIGGMAFNDETFKDVWSSEDGITWNLVDNNPPFGSRQGYELIDYKNNLWVLGRLNIPLYGDGPNDIWYSGDGVSWKKTVKDPIWTGREDIGAVVFKDKIWLLGGMDKNWTWTNDVWSSILSEK